MIKRSKYLSQLIDFRDTDLIKVITGVRRSGKSVLLMQYRDYLLSTDVPEKSIIYINMEAFEYQNIQSQEDFSQLLQSKINSKESTYYILIDEIQFVSGWQRVINSVRVSYNCDIVITGSNAQLLSGELASLLGGRYVEIPVYPFSFKEFLTSKQIDPSETRKLDQAYLEYEQFGGFPSVVLSQASIKDTILSGIFDSIVLHDIAFRGEVQDTQVLKSIIRFLADNVGQLVNPNKIANVLTSEGLKTNNKTVSRYIELLENAFLFYKTSNYDMRGKQYLRTQAKYFIVDNGLRRHAVGKKGANFGNRLENIVHMELKRRGYDISVGRLDQQEIDFIARKFDDLLYVQVAYDLPDSNRETDNLLLIKDNYQKIIITGRYQDTHEIDGIEVKYIVDWLLEQ